MPRPHEEILQIGLHFHLFTKISFGVVQGMQWLVLLMMLGASEKTMVGCCTSTSAAVACASFFFRLKLV